MWKGSLVREIIDLPGFWWKVMQNELPEITTQKIDFGESRFQFFVFLKPKTEIKKVVIYYHGGGWMFGNPKYFIGYVAPLLAEGYAVILPTYRRVPFVNFLKIREDLTLGMHAIFDLLKKEKLDHLPVVLGGMSAGAHCAAHIFYDDKELEKSGFSNHPFAGLMLFGAPVDFSKMDRTPILYRLAGRRKSELFKYASPINFLPSKIKKPVFGAHGKKDGLAHFENGLSFFEKLKETQPELTEFLILENETHLDSVAWTHSEGFLRTQILDWLNRIR